MVEKHCSSLKKKSLREVHLHVSLSMIPWSFFKFSLPEPRDSYKKKSYKKLTLM